MIVLKVIGIITWGIVRAMLIIINALVLGGFRGASKSTIK